MAKSEEELKSFLKKVKEESEKCSSLLNTKKKHVAQESLAGSMRPRKRKLSGKEPIPKKKKKREREREEIKNVP